MMEVKIEGPSLDNFSANAAMNLWWKDCSTTSRVQPKPQKKYKNRMAGKDTETQVVDVDDTGDEPEAEDALIL